MDIRVIISIDKLIMNKSTGVPLIFAEKLGLSERAVYKYLKFMKEELGAPIEYSKLNMTYFYHGSGQFNFYWNNNYN